MGLAGSIPQAEPQPQGVVARAEDVGEIQGCRVMGPNTVAARQTNPRPHLVHVLEPEVVDEILGIGDEEPGPEGAGPLSKGDFPKSCGRSSARRW